MVCARQLACLLCLLLVCSALCAAAPVWMPAHYHGLLLGRARRAEVVAAFGQPRSESRGPNKSFELHYQGRGEHKGDLTFRLDASGTLFDVEEALPVAIPRTILYKEFGREPLTAHYSIARCAAGAIYRDPRGPIELTFYPATGIVLWPDQYGYDFAAIHYQVHAPGVARPACAGH